MQTLEQQPTGAEGMSIRERMAMLQLDQVGCRGSIPLPPRQPPPRPPSRAATPTSPTATTTTTRKQIPPPLPKRKTSRSSLAESFVSVASTSSSNSSGSNSTTRSVPPAYAGKQFLPVQFPDKKPESPKRVNSLPPIGHFPHRDVKRKPPPLPIRRTTTTTTDIGPPLSGKTQLPVIRRLPPLPPRLTENAPAVPARPRLPASYSEPPPIRSCTRPPPVPLSSRPTARVGLSESPLPCLTCYDFSGPDNHAGLPQFHRSQVRSLPALALALTEPFPSALEKARALFTWFHHNISYDVASFFASNIPAQDPGSTLRSGLAVCAGYAELFAALATHSGLEAVVVTGHGKGYGHSDSSGSPPPYQGNHAWNAVKLAPNYWHLIDPCWGAGHIQGPPTPRYTAALSPENFTSPPSVFGRRHFPEDPRHQHREDGRILTWAEYATPEIERPKCYAQFSDLFGFSKETLVPATRNIADGPQRQRFAVSLPCGHLPEISPQDEYVLFLNVGAQFDVKNFYLLQPDGTGRGFECVVDIPRERGVKVTLYYATQFDGREGKGLGRDYFQRKVGKCGWGWSPVVEWGGED